ncbi:MAG: hypothetical protein NTV86_09270 [Planctomycetota bacterium]|nr:hypothetical protein [Planctomycetota bacterium]
MTGYPRPHRRPRRQGFTLVEAAISVAIVGGLVVASLYALGGEARGRSVQTAGAVADGLAASLLSEILQGKYVDPTSPTFGPETGETARSAFEDVDDYNGWTENPPQNKDGTTLTGYTGWRRSVVVAYVDPATLAVSGSDTGLKKITVTVTDPQNRQTVVSALRGSSGTYDQPNPQTSTTYVAWVGIGLQVGSNPAGRITSGTNLPAQVP